MSEYLHFDRFGPLPADSLISAAKALMAAKSQLDDDYPDHARDMSSAEMLEVAAAYVFECFSTPDPEDSVSSNSQRKIIN